MADKQILAVAGYELIMTDDGKIVLGGRALEVCRQIAKIYLDYDHIIMLGGWGGTRGLTTTTGAHMAAKAHLVGVPNEKFMLPRQLGFDTLMPARDTGEERKLLRCILHLEAFDGAVVDAILVRQWYQETRLIDRAISVRGKPLEQIIRSYIVVDCDVPLGQRIRTPIAYWHKKLRDDPFGTKMPMGPLFRKNRRDRTMIENSGLEPLTPD